MRVRGLLALGLLLVAVGIERAAYFGARTLLGLHLAQLGAGHDEIGTTFAMLQGVSLVGMLLAGAVAFAVGPRAAAAGGLVLATIGDFALAAGAPPVAGAAAVTLGAAVFRCCIYAAAAAELAWDDESPAAPEPYRFAAVAAFAVAVGFASNVGGFIGPPVAGVLHRASWTVVCASAGVGKAFAALLATGAALVGRKPPAAARGGDAGPYRAPPPPRPPPAPPQATLVGLAVLFVAAALGEVGAAEAMHWPTLLSISAADRAWLYAVGPAATILASLGVFAILLVGVVLRWSLPPLLLFGVGLVVLAIGLVPSAAAGDSTALHACGAALAGFGEAAAFTVPIAYAAIDVRGRAATLVVGGWSAATTLVYAVATALAGIEGLRSPLLGLCAVLCLGAGVAMIARARHLHGMFFEPAPAAGGSPAEAWRGSP